MDPLGARPYVFVGAWHQAFRARVNRRCMVPLPRCAELHFSQHPESEMGQWSTNRQRRNGASACHRVTRRPRRGSVLFMVEPVSSLGTGAIKLLEKRWVSLREHVPDTMRNTLRRHIRSKAVSRLGEHRSSSPRQRVLLRHTSRLPDPKGCLKRCRETAACP